MTGGYRLLLDENVEPIATEFRARGHDVETVEGVPELGIGADDATDIVPYARRTGRLVLTYDDHFTGAEGATVDPRNTPGVLFIPDESLTADRVVRIVDTMARYLPPDDLDGRVQHVTRAWLDYR